MYGTTTGFRHFVPKIADKFFSDVLILISSTRLDNAHNLSRNCSTKIGMTFSVTLLIISARVGLLQHNGTFLRVTAGLQQVQGRSGP